MVNRHICAIKRNRTMGCADNGKCSLAPCGRSQHGQLQRDQASLQQHSEHQKPGDRMFEQRTRRHDRTPCNATIATCVWAPGKSTMSTAPKRYFEHM
jgi:hypothetical protein